MPVIDDARNVPLDGGSPSDGSCEREAYAYAGAVFGSDIALFRCRGGRNSRVYRVRVNAVDYALKLYPDDGRGRASREFSALAFFEAAGTEGVARPLKLDGAGRFGLYSWVDGERIAAVHEPEIDALAAFAASLHELARLERAQSFADAVEACFDVPTIVEGITARLERFTTVVDPELQTFLRREFEPELRRRLATGAAVAAVSCVPSRTLSPSDFGFHNALRSPVGEIIFLDFEYFGWDDPIKLVADVCWHPGMSLPAELRDRFINRCRNVYDAEERFDERLTVSFPLFGLRWCLIVLNEFLPDMWARRVAAGIEATPDVVRSDQLIKARGLLERVRAYERK